MAEVIYYFNARGDVVWTDPDNIVDNNLATFGYTAVNAATQVLNGNSCPGTDLGSITKVELRLYGKGDGDDHIVITPVFTGGDGDAHETTPVVSPGDWTSFVDITNDTNHPNWSLWSHIQTIDCKLTFDKEGKSNTVYCAKVEIRVTYTEPWVPPVADIDVGADPIDRASTYGIGKTYVDKNNPANASGTLHSIKIYANTDISGLIVGTFYLTNGSTLKCRDSEAIPGTVTAGAERTFTELSITVETGDYIGCYFTGGSIERDLSGYAGLWVSGVGEFIDPGDETAYTFLAGDAISLYGYGDFGVTEKFSSDTGSGVDAKGSNNPKATLSGSEVGSGVDAVASGNPLAFLVGAETGSGLDAVVALFTGAEFVPRRSAVDGYRCFMEQYVKNKVLGTAPWKLPDGTKW